MAMRRTRSQMKIDFPAQKLTSTRSISKLKIEEEENTRPGRRRLSKAASKAKLIKSPVKDVPTQKSNASQDKIPSKTPPRPISASPFYSSPAKRRMTFDENTENLGCSPTKKRNTSGDPVRPSPLVSSNQASRFPLSPRRDNILLPRPSKHLSPVGLGQRNKTPSDNIPSPRRIRALNFGDENCATPEINPAGKDTSKARALAFSPVKNISPVKTYKPPTTPSKFTGLRGCESPVKNGQSPLRNSSIISPVKTFYSPTKCLSPVRRLGLELSARSPVKRIGIESPMKRMSPIKRIGLESPRRSPRKCMSPIQKIGLESPRRSPRKCMSPVKRFGFESPERVPCKGLKSPLRLARQEAACYQKAKQALHTALPENLVCREKEYKEVNDFLDNHIKKKTSGSLYISGAPGTGKTAVLSKTMHRIREEGKVQIIYINCMSFKNSAAIYNRVLGDLQGKESKMSIKDATKALEKGLTTCKSMITLILDEVDQLDSKNQEVLYTMFEWPAIPKSKLILIGIANALDLTDRILPRLQARPKCKPKIMNFPPYSKDQLVAVLKDRLSRVEVGGEVVMEPAAVQFCARKVAAVAGDMRKALDVCRRAVEMVEVEVRKQQVIQACRSPSKKSVVPKKIGVAHILKIVNEVYGNRVSVQTGPQTIPLQQKLAICTLLLMMKHGKHKEVTMGKYHETFSKVCRQQNVAGVDQSEFLSMVSLIEARGIVLLKKGKDTRNAKVTLKLDEKELETALQDRTLMSNILSKGLPGK